MCRRHDAVGSFLLLARIRARVDAQALVLPLLDAALARAR